MTRRPYIETAHDRARKARVWLDQPGLYAITLVKGAVEVPVEVRCEPTPDPGDPDNAMDRSAWWSIILADGTVHRGPHLFPNWSITGRRIDRAEYDYLKADRQWAAAHGPHLPEATPDRPVDLASMDPATLF